MRILVFTEGTILMHKSVVGHTREDIVQQVKDKEPSVKDYITYFPIDDAVHKIQQWANQGAEIVYMTSRRRKKEINEIQSVLDRYQFPKGALVYRKWFERYKNVVARVMPDILVEDDCESIGGERQMTYPHIRPLLQERIKSIVVSEFLASIIYRMILQYCKIEASVCERPNRQLLMNTSTPRQR